MRIRTGIEVSHAVAEAVKVARVDVISAYPITPQTHIVERLAELVANGELDAIYMNVESEHSALSACVGASATGARTFTSTSAQGLELMHEILYITSALRLPVVMVIANRALSAPLSIWADHSDAMATRDTGWISLFCENGQDAFDSVIMAYRIGEDRRVLLPVMVNLDGFSVSHVVEPVEFLGQEEVDDFLPPFDPPFRLDPDRPVTFGAYGMPEIYTEAKYAQEMAIRGAKAVVTEVMEEFEKRFGRSYRVIEVYGELEGSHCVFLALGSINENIKTAIDGMNKEGMKAALLALRLFRPFPAEEISSLLSRVERLAVIERVMPGGSCNGPLYVECASVAFGLESKPILGNYIVGLGGRDCPGYLFREIYKDMLEKRRTEGGYKVMGVRS